MAWKNYELDQKAQQLVLRAKQRDNDSLNQAYKMRVAVAYGLERFWGEPLRLQGREANKAQFWQETWTALVEIMAVTGMTVPNDTVRSDDTASIEAMSQQLWAIGINDQRLILAVLTQLCDAIVWWTQRYK